MKFSKAHTGLTFLLISEILTIISSVFVNFFLLILDGIFSDIVNTFGNIGLTVILTGFELLGLLALILQLVGLGVSIKDEPLFKTAFVMVFLGIIATIASLFFSGTIEDILSGINAVTTLLVSVYTLLGIHSIAYQLEDKTVVRGAKVTLIVVAFIFTFSVFTRMTTIFTPVLENTLNNVWAILDIVGHIIFLTYIIKAKKMLTK